MRKLLIKIKNVKITSIFTIHVVLSSQCSIFIAVIGPGEVQKGFSVCFGGTVGAKPTPSIVNLIINYVIAEKQWCHVINRTATEHCRANRPAMPRRQQMFLPINQPTSSLVVQSVKEFADITYNGQLPEFMLYKEKSMETEPRCAVLVRPQESCWLLFKYR